MVFLSTKRYLGKIRAEVRRTPRRVALSAKLATSPLQQFIPFSTLRTDTDSCVITNGVPKSGTFLLKSIVVYLNQWADFGAHLHPTNWQTLARAWGEPTEHTCTPRYALRKLRNGQVVSGHLHWTSGLEREIRRTSPERRIKHLFIYRDQRDVFVSNMNSSARSENYLKYSGSDAKNQRKYLEEKFSNDDELLAYFIQYKRDLGLKNGIREFLPWLYSPNCLALKFEDLYQDIVGLREGFWGDTLVGILDYLEVAKDDIDPSEFYDGVYGKSHNASDEEHKIGQYKRVFKDQHYALLDEPEFRETLQLFGYTW